jgi:hypothetical protein
MFHDRMMYWDVNQQYLNFFVAKYFPNIHHDISKYHSIEIVKL